MKKEKHILNNKETLNPFSVPNGYFDSFRIKLNERIENTQKVDMIYKNLSWLKLKMQYALSISVIFLLLIVGVYVFINNLSSISNLSDNEYLTFVNISEEFKIDENSIENALNESETNIENNSVKNDTIQFLIDDNIDYALLINEL